MNFADAIEHGAAVKRGRNAKSVLAHMRIEEAENGGHSVEHHFESAGGTYHEPKTFVFGKPEGAKPQLPEGHILTHIAEHMGIPHEAIGGNSEEPEEDEKE